MIDKQLGESEWKKFAKGRDLKDAALVKALATLEQAKDPAQQLKALDEIEKQAEALRKAGKGDKELTGYLDAVDKALVKQRKASASDAAAAAEAQADDEPESPDLLTTRLVPLLRQVKQGETVQALLAIAGKDLAVLLSRRSISPSRRKLLQDYLQASTVKPLAGTCVFEDNAYTFVVATQAAGLAKKLKAALLKQTGLRLKVQVRGEDGLDDDGEPAEADDAAATAPHPAAPAAADPARARFDARLAALAPRLAAALKGDAAGAAKVRALVDFARAKAQGGHAVAALQALDAVEGLLATGSAAGSAAATPSAAEPPRVDYAKCRLVWDAAKKKVQAELATLEQAILADFRGDPAFAEIATRVRKLDAVMQGFADDLSGTLERAAGAAQPDERRRHHDEAAAVIARFLDRASNDPLVAELDGNPFVPVQARATLLSTLGTLSKLVA